MPIKKRTWPSKKKGVGFKADFRVKGRRVRRQFKSQAEARAYEDYGRRQARAGTWRAETVKMTVAQLVPEYVTHLDKLAARKQRAATTVRQRKSQIRHYVLGGVPIVTRDGTRSFDSGIGDTRLDELDQAIVVEWLGDVADEGHTIGTCWEIKGALSGMCEFAKDVKKYISLNPTVGLKRSAFRRRPNHRVQPPPKELVRRLVSAAEPRLAFRIKFASVTGLRAGEQWGLRWRDVDLVREVIRVERSYNSYDGEGETKTEAGVRHVPISSSFAKELERWRAESQFQHPDHLVFPNTRGNHESHGNIVPRFHAVFEEVAKTWPCDLAAPERPRWHSLRHFAVSCWIEAGIAPKVIQTYVGHLNFITTMDTYGHLFDRPKRDGPAMERIISDLFGPEL